MIGGRERDSIAAAEPAARPWRTSRRGCAALLALWAALLPAFALWLWRDRTYAPWDHAYHAHLALRLADGIAHGNPWRFYELDRFYPPLFHALAAPAALVGDHPDLFAAGNWLALLALLFATYAMAAQLGGPHVGLAAAALVPGYAYVAWMGRMPMTDLVQAAAVAWTLALLVRPLRLGEPGDARRLGIAIGLGMLARWSYAFFAAVPLALAALEHLRASRVRAGASRRGDTAGDRARGLARAAGAASPWRALGTAALWAAALAAPWYVRSVPYIVGRLSWHLGAGVAAAEGDPPGLTLASLAYYGDVAARCYMSAPTWALLAAGSIGLAIAWRRRDAAIAPPARWAPLLVSAASGLAVLIAIGNKDERYLLPVVPAVAAVSAAWIALLPERRRGAAVAACALLGYGLAIRSLFWLAPPDPTEWRVEETAEAIARDLATTPAGGRILVVPNEPQMNFMSLDYAIERRAGRKVETDRVEMPLRDADLAAWTHAVLVLPPPAETVLSRHSVAAAELLAARPDWEAIASLARGDGREIRVLRFRGSIPGPSPGVEAPRLQGATTSRGRAPVARRSNAAGGDASAPGRREGIGSRTLRRR